MTTLWPKRRWGLGTDRLPAKWPGMVPEGVCSLESGAGQAEPAGITAIIGRCDQTECPIKLIAMLAAGMGCRGNMAYRAGVFLKLPNHLI